MTGLPFYVVWDSKSRLSEAKDRAERLAKELHGNRVYVLRAEAVVVASINVELDSLQDS